MSDSVILMVLLGAAVSVLAMLTFIWAVSRAGAIGPKRRRAIELTIMLVVVPGGALVLGYSGYRDIAAGDWRLGGLQLALVAFAVWECVNAVRRRLTQSHDDATMTPGPSA